MQGVQKYMLVFFVGLLLGMGGVFGLQTPEAVEAQTLTPEQRAKLQAEYDKIQEEIVHWQGVLNEARLKKNTLQGDVTILNAQIKKAEAEIKSRNNTIAVLGKEIDEKSEHIQTLEEKLEEGRTSLAQLIRQKQEAETTPLAILMLSSEGLSEFFSAVDAIDVINRDLQTHFNELRGIRAETEKEKEKLSEKKNAELDAKYEVEIKRKHIKKDEEEKKELLSIAVQEEASYSQVLAERERRAAEIRSALFELRDAQGIPFEVALQYANEASKKTGVRPAFILGILRQESNLGQNVGQCLLVDASTGAGKGKNTGTPFSNVMHPTRDVPVFLDVTKRLGRDPYSTVVSCPQSIGYGGAMGPSQFIPSTWKNYEGKLAAALGVSTADPWIPKHAVMATGLFLTDLGAGLQTYSAEREAAGRYYAGGNWATLGLTYAANVLAFAEKYQNDIDFLNENNL